MKVKLLFPYAVSCVFGGMGRAWGMAMVGLHVVLCIIKVLSFTTDPEVARFWVPIFRVWVYLGIAAIVLMTCVNIVYYMPVYGVCAFSNPFFKFLFTRCLQLHVLLLSLLKAPLEIWKMLQVLLVLLLNGINGKDQRAEKIVLSLAPPVKAKIEDRWWHTSVKAHHLTKELGHAVLAEQSRKLIKDSHRCLVLLDVNRQFAILWMIDLLVKDLPGVDYPLLDAGIWEHFDVAAPCIVFLLFDKWINGKDQRGGKLFLSLAPQLIKGVSIHYLRFS
ncbi:unnamed protein product [Miscanthus lutarioriparius]|uniref:Uncharacterized protein n=1 Tax=Miscanthus lutarioriparius TaxID=422564 RepID=A0A811SP16_9POAL|nr:unnamed protein product [Miscanthus lutarioriparius]